LENSYYRVITNAFNEYSREEGLGIEVELKVLTPDTAESDRESYSNTIDTLLLKKSSKYDLYFYFSTYIEAYGNHFIDLGDYLPKEYSDVFDEIVLNKGCSSNGKLLALPIYLDFGTLFSNQELLLKYNKEIPKTWDELLSTSKYIYDEEKKINNTIIRYHSSMNDDSGSASFYEFINSFRENNTLPYPEIKSKEAIEALKKLKEMKGELGENILKDPEGPIIPKLLYGVGNNYLFIRYFYMKHIPLYKVTALPGKKKGVCGAFLKSTNISISKYVEEERKKAAIEYLKFITLKETQKKYIINNNLYSAMTELYEDEEVCNVIECDVIKDIYPFSFRNNDVNLFGDDLYNTKYTNAILDYLYKNHSLSETIKIIDDMTKIYKFSLKMDDSKVGFIIFIVFLVFFAYMILSVMLLFNRKLKKRFTFLSLDLWFVTILGSLILMSSLMTLYEDVTNAKCHLRIALINVGFMLSVAPSLLKLITNFPVNNKVSLWFDKKKYISLLIIMIFTVSLNGIFAISSYHIQNVTMSDKSKYNKCIMKNVFGNIIYYIIQIYDIFVILISLILIFMEWNLEETTLDIKYLATALSMDILSFLLLNIIDKIKLDYIVYNLLLAINILFFSVFSHLFTYLVRVLSIFRPDAEFEDSMKILKRISDTSSKRFSMEASSFNNSTPNKQHIENTSVISTPSSNKSKINGLTQKIINYHNQTSISN